MNLKLFSILLICLGSCGGTISAPNKKLVIFAVTTERTDGYLQFVRSLRIYGLKLQKLSPTGQNYTSNALKLNIFNKELEIYKDRSDVIVLFTDTYDVIFTAGEEEILKRFEGFHSNVVFSAESNCSPFPNLASRYPEVENGYRFLNSGGFIGYASAIYDMLPEQDLTEDFDDQLYYTLTYLDESTRSSIGITLDTQAVIFQSLHGAQKNVSLVYLEDDTKLQNHFTNTTPLIVHGNGNDGKLFLRTLSGYLAKSWTPSKGCLSCEEGRMDFTKLPIEEYPMVLMAIFIDKPTYFLEKKLNKVSELLYPKERIYLFVSNKVTEHDDFVQQWVNRCKAEYADSKYISSLENNMTIGGVRELAIKMCLNRPCDLLFNIDSEVTIENPQLLEILISYRKTALAPVMVEPGTSRSTFWGGITEEFKYEESFDYMDIISNKRRGIWNVPQLFHIYVIWRYILENPFFDGGITGLSVHPDISMSHIVKITKYFSMFLFAINLDYYGYLSDMNNKSMDTLHNNILKIRQKTPSNDWEENFLHPQFQEHLEKNFSSKTMCPDVFSFPLFSEKFCGEIGEIVESKIMRSSKSDYKENNIYDDDNSSINPGVLSMDNIGYGEEWKHMVRKYVKPLVEEAFSGYHCKGEARKNVIGRRTKNNFLNGVVQKDIGTVAIIVALGTKSNYSQDDAMHYVRYNCSIKNIPVGWAIVFPGKLTHAHSFSSSINGENYILYAFID